MNGRHPNVCLRRTDKAPIVGLLRSIHDVPVGQTLRRSRSPMITSIYIYICMYIANSLLFGFLRATKSMELFLHTLGAHSNSGH